MDPISLLMIGAMALVFWLFILRPQTKQAKQAKEFQASLDKGARVVTTGGIHGKIIKADETSVLMEVDNNVKLRVEKSHIHMEMTQTAYGDAEKKADAAPSK
jgi:preprotein translocase subunit YajC